ncbi:MAG: tetratricopeptide repeat protein [Prevotella sp.]|nr:tetratricopeptide repeat protein [Prevotella sp.]
MRRLFFIFSMLQLFIATANAQADRQHIRQGNKLYRQEKYDKAEVEYQKALAANQRNPQAIYNLGCAMMMQQKDSAAIVQFENAGKLETDKRRKSMAFHNMGWVCQKHQMYAEAIEAYKESLRNNPDDNETRYNLALCQRQQKKNQQNQGGGGKDDKKQDDEQDKKDKKDQNQQQDQQKQQQQPPKDQMSKENAEQLLNAAMQEEKATQQRMKKSMQHPNRRRLQKNW